MTVTVAGAASRIEGQFASGVERPIRDVVREALADAGISLSDVDYVVTVASDALDGMMVPVRAELAGALGKSYLNVPSSAGHALAAAATVIEAGDAETVLVVGWGAASKLAGDDGRSNQFDPFYMRPAGATPETLAAVQRQVLVAAGLLSVSEVEAHAARMAAASWPGGAGASHAFCDGAVAIVLTGSKPPARGLSIVDHATASRSHAPLDATFDPAVWTSEALGSFVRGGASSQDGFVEVSGTTPCAELRAISAVLGSESVVGAGDSNRTGGGAAAWFGPATGLRAFAELFRMHSATDRGEAHGVFVDLAGPLGQLVTALRIEKRSAA